MKAKIGMREGPQGQSPLHAPGFLTQYNVRRGSFQIQSLLSILKVLGKAYFVKEENSYMETRKKQQEAWAFDAVSPPFPSILLL